MIRRTTASVALALTTMLAIPAAANAASYTDCYWTYPGGWNNYQEEVCYVQYDWWEQWLYGRQSGWHTVAARANGWLLWG
jgi:hypothetical protein